MDVLTGLSVAGENDFSVKQPQFKQKAFSCEPTKRPEILENMNIYDAKGNHLRSTEVTHICRGRFHVCRCKGLPHMQRNLQRHPHDCRWPVWLMEDYLSIRRALWADVTPLDAARGRSEDNFRFTVAYAHIGPFGPQKEGYLRRLAQGPLRPMEDLLRHVD